MNIFIFIYLCIYVYIYKWRRVGYAVDLEATWVCR